MIRVDRRAFLSLMVAALVLSWMGVDPGRAQAGPLERALTLDGHPAERLTAPQREAARALGEANRRIQAGQLGEAEAALARARQEPKLSGYVELAEIHLLMKQGQHAAAHRVATEAIGRSTRDGSSSDALRTALEVLQGESLAMGGDASGAELAWKNVLGEPAAQDEAVRQSIELAIVAARQRTGSLDRGIDPRVLLDQSFSEVPVASLLAPTEAVPPELVLARAQAAFEAGHTERSIGLYDQAISATLDPAGERAAKMGRAHALFRSRRYESAAKAFGTLLPNVEARFWRARSLARSGDIDGALTEFEGVAGGADEELASWALYLMGTIHEDRDERKLAIGAFQRAARYERFPDRVRKALWREGWAQYRIGAYGDARRAFTRLVERYEDPLDALRPRYWSARAAMLAGDGDGGRAELDEIARGFPLTYYGWRAQERLTLDGGELVQANRKLAAGTRRVDDETIERAALLIEADLDELARDELRFAARRARGFVDRTHVGVLLAQVGDYHRANQLVVTAYADSLARGLQPGREALWWLSWPPAYADLIAEVFPADTSIERELVWAIMREESHYRVDARSSAGALGLLQLMPSTATQLAAQNGLEGFEVEDLYDPKTNITLGARYLAQLASRFNGRMSAAIGSYNAGPRKVSAWLEGEGAKLEDDVWVENIPYDQTRAYVKRVLRSLHVYKSFYR